MTTDEKNKIEEIAKTLNLEGSDIEGLSEFLLYLFEKGININSSNIIIRKPEYFHHNLVFNRILDVTRQNEPPIWEISSLENQYNTQLLKKLENERVDKTKKTLKPKVYSVKSATFLHEDLLELNKKISFADPEKEKNSSLKLFSKIIKLRTFSSENSNLFS